MRRWTNMLVLAALAIAILGASVLTASAARADYEAVSFGVNDFTSGGTCSAADIAYCDDYIALYQYYAASSAYWDYDYVRTSYSFDNHVDGEDLTDEDQYAWGDDDVSPYGSDFADAIFLCTHGRSKCMEISDPYDEETGEWRCCGYDARCGDNYSFNYGGFKDFKDTGAHSMRVLYRVSDCDPNQPGYDLATYDRPALPDL